MELSAKFGGAVSGRVSDLSLGLSQWIRSSGEFELPLRWGSSGGGYHLPDVNARNRPAVARIWMGDVEEGKVGFLLS
jgi:hypothetical protein